MAWGRKQRDASPQGGMATSAAHALDLSKYDLDGFRADFGEIVDLPGAVGEIVKRAALVTLAFSLILYLVFSPRLGSTALFVFMIAAIACSIAGAVAVAVFMLMRKRVGQTKQAAGRVIELVEMMHLDYQQVQKGVAQLSLRDVGSEIAQHIVFPVAFGAAGQATALAGPLGFLLRPALRLPIAWVERTVVGALDGLSDAAVLGGSEPADATTETARADASVHEVAATTTSAVNAVVSEYAGIQHKVKDIVSGLGVAALGPVGALMVVSLLPLLALVSLTWVMT